VSNVKSRPTVTAASATPAHVKAHATRRWAETLFRALSSRVADRWKFAGLCKPSSQRSASPPLGRRLTDYMKL
jgi:hypothetical protein